MAKKAKVDIAANKFNVFGVLSTALAVGHTVAYSGKTIRLGVKSMLVSQDIPESVAEKLGAAATTSVFTSTVMLLTTLQSRIPMGLKNYHGKVIGDMTKNIGLIYSVDAVRPVVKHVQNAVHSALDSFEDMISMPEVLKRASHAVRDPAMIFVTHQLLIRGITSKNGKVLHPRSYDLVVGYCLGGFLGIFESPHKYITDRTLGDHVTVWTLLALSTLTTHYLTRGKAKVD